MLLDGTPNITQYIAFRKYNKPNAVNRAMSRLLTRNQQGYKVDAFNVLNQTPTVDNQSGETDAKTTLAYVSVSEYCPLLNKLNVLDPAEYKNLRLVIEFEPDRNAWLSQDGSTSHTTARPRLVMDILEPGSWNPNPATIAWNAIESDRFECAALAVNEVKEQSNVNRLNGFNSKLVGRILITKNLKALTENFTANDINGFGRYASHAQSAEQIQITVNGAQQLPRNGVQGSGNRQLSMLNDTWGECNTIPYGNCLGVPGQAGDGNWADPVKAYIGQQSYFGMFVNKRVKDFQVSLTRTGLIDNTGGVNPTNSALSCIVYAEISKSIVNQGGTINVVYN